VARRNFWTRRWKDAEEEKGSRVKGGACPGERRNALADTEPSEEHKGGEERKERSHRAVSCNSKKGSEKIDLKHSAGKKGPRNAGEEKKRRKLM